MAFKQYVIVAALLVAAASAGLIAPTAYQLPQLTAARLPVKLIREEPHNPHPQYSYGYEVHDPNTGDVKSQHETRDGGVVRGSYSLIEADGSKRTVKYTADEYHGFNAVVEKEPAKIAVTQAPSYNFKPIAYQPEPTIAHPQLTETEVQAFLRTPFGFFRID